MMSLYARSGFAALILIAALPAAAASTASAQNPEAGIDFIQTGPRYQPRKPGERPTRVQVCAPTDALDQARGNGFRRIRLRNVAEESVVVEGQGRYGWGRMVFANLPGCPAIAR